jgi:hypothetical protein
MRDVFISRSALKGKLISGFRNASSTDFTWPTGEQLIIKQEYRTHRAHKFTATNHCYHAE